MERGVVGIGTRVVRAVAVLVVVVGLLLGATQKVEAHARLIGVLPAPSSTVPGPLRQVLIRFNERIDPSLFRVVVTTDNGSGMAGPPVFQDERTIVVPIRNSALGVLEITWLAVGVDAHPTTGQFVIGVRNPAENGAALNRNISLAASRVGGSFESGAGGGGLLAVIEAGRAVEITFLYVMLGIVLMGVLVLRPRLTLAIAGTGIARQAYRVLLVVGAGSAVMMPVLFGLYAARLLDLFSGIGLSKILFSSIGELWAIKAVLWLALLGVVVVILRRTADGRRQDRLLLALAGLALALAAAFVANTHIGTGSANPSWLYIPMQMAHTLLTALWVGGLLAMLLVVFPSGNPEQIWAAVSRFSRIMTVTLVLLLASGVIILLKMLANLNALWCTSYGLVAGFKVMTVLLAMSIGLVNNRLVAGHRHEEELSPAARNLMRRRGPSIQTLKRVITAEAGLLLGVVILAAVLGETQLPPLFTGHLLPGETQESGIFVTTGLFSSGCT